MSRDEISVVAITISSPLLIGLYKNNTIFKEFVIDGKTSDVLPEFFDQILNEYEIKTIIYVNGPGSFMSIKIATVFFQTLAIVKNIDLFTVDGFYFSNNQPISATGKSAFVKNSFGNIEIVKKDEKVQVKFSLKPTINIDDFSSNLDPIYVVPAV